MEKSRRISKNGKNWRVRVSKPKKVKRASYPTKKAHLSSKVFFLQSKARSSNLDLQRMVVVSPRLLSNGSGLIRLPHREIPSHRIQRRDGFGPSSFKFSGDSSLNGRVSYTPHVGASRTVSVRFARQSPSFHDDLPEAPLWLSLLRDIVWSTRSLFSFMAEQPSQLKYIEWPSFTTTLKTATLSLFLVAVFIVALSSVDSALCYILTLILRKAP